MGGDPSVRVLHPSVQCLNPPRPHGRGPNEGGYEKSYLRLKSTPPAWAGTKPESRRIYTVRA